MMIGSVRKANSEELKAKIEIRDTIKDVRHLACPALDAGMIDV